MYRLIVGVAAGPAPGGRQAAIHALPARGMEDVQNPLPLSRDLLSHHHSSQRPGHGVLPLRTRWRRRCPTISSRLSMTVGTTRLSLRCSQAKSRYVSSWNRHVSETLAEGLIRQPVKGNETKVPAKNASGKRRGRWRSTSRDNQGQNPTGVGGSQADASAVQSDMSKQAKPQQIAILVVMGLICLAIGAIGISGAITDFRKVETTGVILETRIDRPGSKFWNSEGLIEYTGGDQVHREWLLIERHSTYRHPDEKGRGRVGETRAV